MRWVGRLGLCDDQGACRPHEPVRPDAHLVGELPLGAVLGNTPAVCRRNYVHLDVLDAFREGDLRDRVRRRNAGNTPAGLRPPEAAVLDLLRERG